MIRLLALDFDGVISNSAPEAFVVALRTWTAMRPDSRLARALGSVGGAAAPAPDAVTNHDLYAGFLANMPLGNRAEDYAVILAAVEAERTLADQEAYDAFRSGFDLQWLRDYHKRFYSVRAEIRAADSLGWQQLMRPYQPFLDVLRRRSGSVTLCITTAKDRASVRKLLEVYGVDDLFPEGRVLDKETGERKSAHLKALHAELGFEFPEMTFVDDKVNHLVEVGRLGVRCALATWGFNGPRELDQARAAGFPACTLSDAEDQLFD